MSNAERLNLTCPESVLYVAPLIVLHTALVLTQVSLKILVYKGFTPRSAECCCVIHYRYAALKLQL